MDRSELTAMDFRLRRDGDDPVVVFGLLLFVAKHTGTGPLAVLARWRRGEIWSGANWLRWIFFYAAMAMIQW
jgi:hypothetical protein